MQEFTPKIVLVVDSEPVVLKFVSAALRHDGHRVIAIRSPQDAWVVSAAQDMGSIGMLIGDLLMFQAGMPELVNSLRRSNPNLQLLCITCLGEWEVRQTGGWGDIPVLHKPFTARALRDAVSQPKARQLSAAGSRAA